MRTGGYCEQDRRKVVYDRCEQVLGTCDDGGVERWVEILRVVVCANVGCCDQGVV